MSQSTKLEQNELLLNCINSSIVSVLICEIKDSYNVVFASEHFKKCNNTISISAEKNVDYFSLIHSKDRHRIKQEIETNRKNNIDKFEIQFRFNCINDKHNWFTSYSTVSRNRDCEPEFLFNLIINQRDLISTNVNNELITNLIDQIYLCFDRTGKVLSANAKAEQVFELKRKELIGLDWVERFVGEKHKKKAVNSLVKYSKYDAEIKHKCFVTSIESASGKKLYIKWKIFTSPVEKSGVPFAHVFATDISELRHKQELAQNMALFPYQNPNPVMRIDRSGNMLLVNDATQELIESLANSTHGDKGHHGWENMMYVAVKRLHRGKFELHVDEKVFLFDIQPIPKTNYINLYGIDITQLRTIESEIEEISLHDYLTNIANRKLYLYELQQMLDTYTRTKIRFSIIAIDIDYFQTVNDLLGHSAGDVVLRIMAKRLKSVLRKMDVIARFGGDEFFIIQKEIKYKNDVEILAKKLLNCFEKRFDVLNESVHIKASIGITIVDDDIINVDQLLEQADIALHMSKQDGRGKYTFYHPDIGKAALNDMRISKNIARALKNNEFFLVYQPQLRTRDHKIIGCEALIRWRDPKRGIISPGEFIPIAENYGLINELGAWVIDALIKQLKLWQKQNIKMPPVSINIAPLQIAQQGFAEKLINKLNKNHIPPSKIKCEILESSYLGVSELVNKNMQLLNNVGIDFSLDDFGTGYSSLSYLPRLPIKTLKIAQELVRDMDKIPTHYTIVKAAIAMAESLNFETIAEGVETQEIEDQLGKMNCHIIQGYLYSKPLEAEQLISYCENHAVA
jgi:diguanylate cyclase (GGDEF)-like protein/PAS domain S-box-containing protein